MAPRVFFGIPFPDEVKRALAAAAEELERELGAPRDFRWIPAANFHLTLKFLGMVPEDSLPVLVVAVREAVAGEAPFAFRVAGTGAFPSPRRPAVLWAGIEAPKAPELPEAPDALTRIAAKVDAACHARGAALEDRPYVPHLTLAKKRGPTTKPRPVAAVFGPESRFSGRLWAEVPVTELVLFESRPTEHGVRYEVLERIPLGVAAGVSGQ